MGPARKARVRAGDGRGNYDASIAAFLEVGECFLDHLKGAVGIDGKHGLPLLIGHFC